MARRTSSQQTHRRHTRRLSTYIHRHWLLIGVIAFLVAVAIAGAPAWAAPSPRPLNQTVPRPTPTTPGDPVATATPRSDSGSDDDNESDDGENATGGSGERQLDTTLPNELLDGNNATPAAETTATTGSDALTASVAVGQLNARAQANASASVVGTLTANQQVTVEARNASGTWWYVCCVNGNTRGWVSAQLMTPSFARADANTLLPIFEAKAAATPEPTKKPAQATGAVKKAESPLTVDFMLDPPFLWQGITGTLTITVTNPNAVDVVNAELSDELPATMRFLDAAAGAGGSVIASTTETGNTLLLFRWPQVPSETSVTATINFSVADTLEDGAVFDNLVGIQASNAGYASGAITIGMPPVLPPSFD